MNTTDLISATQYMWGSDPIIEDTIIDGIYNTTTARHGGYLVDITKIPELSKYGDKTNIPNIRAFEEDYEALKVLWLFPELLNNPEESYKWLTAETVNRFDRDNSFLEDFPKRRILDTIRKEEEFER